MPTPAFLVELKAIGLRDLYHIQGFMGLLMKPRNGMPWTPEDKAAIRFHLKIVGASLPMLAVFTLPGGMLLLPLLAWYLDRRKQKLILSISPDSIKSPPRKSTETETEVGDSAVIFGSGEGTPSRVVPIQQSSQTAE